MESDSAGRYPFRNLSFENQILCEKGIKLLYKKRRMSVGLSVVDLLHGGRRALCGSQSESDHK